MRYETITSRSNQRLKHLKKLLSDRDYRYEQGEYVIEGPRAMDGVRDIRELFVCEGVAVPSGAGSRVTIVAPDIFGQLAATEHSQGILAVAGLTVHDASSLRRDGRYVLLDQLQDPGNMGTIIRICCAFALTGIIVPPGCVDPFAPKVVRSAAGAMDKLEIVRVPSLEALQGHTLIAADARGQDAGRFAWPESFILAIGNEAAGLSQTVRQSATATVAVPMSGCMESLNAAVSAGILLYCATQRRR